MPDDTCCSISACLQSIRKKSLCCMNVTETYGNAALLENESPAQVSVMSQHIVKSFRLFLYAKIWGGQCNTKIDNLFLAASSSSFSSLSPERELLLFCLLQTQERGANHSQYSPVGCQEGTVLLLSIIYT